MATINQNMPATAENLNLLNYTQALKEAEISRTQRNIQNPTVGFEKDEIELTKRIMASEIYDDDRTNRNMIGAAIQVEKGRINSDGTLAQAVKSLQERGSLTEALEAQVKAFDPEIMDKAAALDADHPRAKFWEQTRDDLAMANKKVSTKNDNHIELIELNGSKSDQYEQAYKLLDATGNPGMQARIVGIAIDLEKEGKSGVLAQTVKSLDAEYGLTDKAMDLALDYQPSVAKHIAIPEIPGTEEALQQSSRYVVQDGVAAPRSRSQGDGLLPARDVTPGYIQQSAPGFSR